MLRAAFVSTAVDHFSDKSLRVLRCVEQGEVTCLMLVEHAGTCAWRTFSPSQLQVAPLLMRPGFQISVEAMFAGFAPYVQRLDVMRLDAEIQGRQMISHTNADPKINVVTTRVVLRNGFEDFWKRRPKKLRDNLKRYASKAKRELGPLRIVTNQDPEKISAALERYGELESAGWKGRAGTAIRQTNEQGAFYHDLLETFSQKRCARVFELFAGKKLLASRIAIASGRTVVMLKTSYDEAFANVAPGRLLLKAALEELSSSNEYDVVEMYTDATQAQAEWGSDSREIFHVSLYRSPRFARCVYVANLLLRRKSHAPNYRAESHDDFASVPRPLARLWVEERAESIEISGNIMRTLAPLSQKYGARLLLQTLSNRAEEPLGLAVAMLWDGAGNSADARRSLPFLATLALGPVRKTDKISNLEFVTRMIRKLAAVPRWGSLAFFFANDQFARDDLINLARENLLGIEFSETEGFQVWNVPGRTPSERGTVQVEVCKGGGITIGSREQMSWESDGIVEVLSLTEAAESTAQIEAARQSGGSGTSFLEGCLSELPDSDGDVVVALRWLNESVAGFELWRVFGEVGWLENAVSFTNTDDQHGGMPKIFASDALHRKYRLNKFFAPARLGVVTESPDLEHHEMYAVVFVRPGILRRLRLACGEIFGR